MSLFALLGSFMLSDRSVRKKGFTWIGVFFLLLGLNALDALLLFSGFYQTHLSWMLWEDPMALLYGPMIYFFGRRAVAPSRNWKITDLFHLVPFVSLELLVTHFHFTYDSTAKGEILQYISSSQLSPETFLGFLPLFAHLLIYVYLAKRSLSKRQEYLKKYLSTIEISWAHQIINMIFVVFLASFAGSFFRLTGASTIQIGSLLLVIIVSIIITVRLLFQAMKSPLFLERSVESSFTLPETEVTHIRDAIERLLNDEKAYSNPDLSLSYLAKELDVNERAISYVINQTLADNFYDYINEYRINAAKRLLEEHKNSKLTILEVMYQVGFNSKSSFNSQFKKKTGLTPSEFRKKA